MEKLATCTSSLRFWDDRVHRVGFRSLEAHKILRSILCWICQCVLDMGGCAPSLSTKNLRLGLFSSQVVVQLIRQCIMHKSCFVTLLECVKKGWGNDWLYEASLSKLFIPSYNLSVMQGSVPNFQNFLRFYLSKFDRWWPSWGHFPPTMDNWHWVQIGYKLTCNWRLASEWHRIETIEQRLGQLTSDWCVIGQCRGVSVQNDPFLLVLSCS